MLKGLEKSRILITGSEGFIGSHLTRSLVTSGAKVHAIVHPASSLWRIKDISRKIKIYKIDLLDEKKLRKEIFKINLHKIYHLAANTNHERSLVAIDEVFKGNLQATLNLLRLAVKLDLDCFINTGTCEEYGVNPVPFKEYMRESPVSPYSASKVCCTYLGMMFHKIFGLPVVTLRPFLTYGPFQDANMFIPSLIIACLKGKPFKMTHGGQTREFNYVEDIIDGFLKASVNPRAIGEVINLGNGKEYKISQVARTIKELTGSRIRLQFGSLPYRKGEAMHFYSSPDKAKKLLSWSAKVGLEKGLRNTIEWYEKTITN